MSGALQSLMPDMRRAPVRPPLFSGVVAFAGIGALGAALVVGLTTIMMALNPALAGWLVNTVCYVATIVPIYLLHRRYSFDSDAPHWQALPRYVTVQVMALVLTAVFSVLLHEVLGAPAMAASMLVVVLTAGANFIVLRSWAFARTQLAAPATA